MATTAVIEKWNSVAYESSGAVRLIGVASTKDYVTGAKEQIKVRVDFATTDGAQSISEKVVSSVIAACAAKSITVEQSGVFYPRIEKGI